MFNNKRIEELEKKVELILDHLGLEYQPRLIEKGFGISKDTEAKVEAIAEIPDIETLKAICPFYHKDEQMTRTINEIKEPKEKTYKATKIKVCEDCGKKIEGINKKRYCDICIAIRRAKNQKRYTEQRHEREQKGKEMEEQKKLKEMEKANKEFDVEV